jgi:hypothetical protein
LWFCAKETSYAKATKVAGRFEGISQKRVSARAVRETVMDLARESYGDAIRIATTRRYFSDWLKMVAFEVGHNRLAVSYFFRSSSRDIQSAGQLCQDFFLRKSSSKLGKERGGNADLPR